MGIHVANPRPNQHSNPRSREARREQAENDDDYGNISDRHLRSPLDSRIYVLDHLHM